MEDRRHLLNEQMAKELQHEFAKQPPLLAVLVVTQLDGSSEGSDSSHWEYEPLFTHVVPGWQMLLEVPGIKQPVAVMHNGPFIAGSREGEEEVRKLGVNVGLKLGFLVNKTVGFLLGEIVGFLLGTTVRITVGLKLGILVEGKEVGARVGVLEGKELGFTVGILDGKEVGIPVGITEGI
jgi:hypothetical protein